MNHYKHFTLKERALIKHYIDLGKNQSEIAILLLGRNKSSISREFKRNGLNGEYFPWDVQSLYLHRRILCKPNWI